MSNMIELMKNIGEENIGVQFIDFSISSFEMTKTKGNRITFNTDQPFNSFGMSSFGVVFWFDRAQYEKIIKQANAKREVIGFVKVLAELSDYVDYQMLDSSVQKLRSLKSCNKVTFGTTEGVKEGTFHMNKWGLIAWCDRTIAENALMAQNHLMLAA